jgi:hypothetical protein
MTPPTKSAADTAALLDRLANLEAKEAERERLIAEREAAQARLEQITSKQPNRQVRDLGTAIAQSRCVNGRCPEFDVPRDVEIRGAETVQFYKDPQGNVNVDHIENSWKSWSLVDDSTGICGSCGRQSGFTGEPGSINVLENASDTVVQNNRDAFVQKLQGRKLTERQIDNWTKRWKEYDAAE